MKTLYGDTIIENVPAVGNAIKILKEQGIEVARAYIYPIIRNNGFGGKEETHVGVYFSNKEGKEIGWYCEIFQHIFILSSPRSVWEGYLKNTKDW